MFALIDQAKKGRFHLGAAFIFVASNLEPGNRTV